MYAIIEYAGKQFRVEKDMMVKLPLVQAGAGIKIEFDKVLMVDDGKAVKVGQPVLDGVKITGKVVEHDRDKKVIVFKKKRRKGYKVKNGHRQPYTMVQIGNISAISKKSAKSDETTETKPSKEKKEDKSAKSVKAAEAKSPKVKKEDKSVKSTKAAATKPSSKEKNQDKDAKSTKAAEAKSSKAKKEDKGVENGS